MLGRTLAARAVATGLLFPGLLLPTLLLPGLLLPAAAGTRAGLPPLAFTRFCLDYPGECAPRGEPDAVVGAEALAQAEAVNDDVNAAIEPTTRARVDGVAAWRIGPGEGDCNDYAVTKRHLLLEAGLPSSALLLTAVVTPEGEDHLVLVLRAMDGDLVLDNLRPEVLPLAATGHRVIRRQSARDPERWLEVASDAPAPRVSRAGRAARPR